MRIFHIATAADWAAAQRVGSYTTSTYGVTLADEGFLHASRGDQWQGVRDRFYGEVAEPLVLLAIDTDKLTAPVVEESPPGTDETFPHIYGPLNPDAVVQVIPLGTGTEPNAAGGESFSRIFLGEMFHNLLLASLVMACVAAGALAGRAVNDEWGALVGIALGVAVGVPTAVLVHRRRTP
jgi:uncharacterized protein (DUF952 family)